METRLVDHFAAEFKQQVGIDVLKHPKGMAKLKKQVKRTKEILSANSEASITVESLADDHDFRYVLDFMYMNLSCASRYPGKLCTCN